MRRVVARALSIAGVLEVLAFADHASASDPAAAQALFDQARKLMTQERWAEACPKLEESQRLDPGGGTLLHLAICRDHEGKIATAWARYQDALGAAKHDNRKDRAKIAQARIDALGPRLPRLRLRVAARNRTLTGFRVSRDDVDVGEAQWGESVPVDPGARVIAAWADGHKRWTTTIDVPARAGETAVEIPALQLDPDAAATATPRRDEPPKPTRIEEATRGDGQRTVGVALGAAGVVGAAVGSIFGLMAISKQREADAECKPPERTLCTAAGVAAGEDGTTFGTVSTVAFIAGGALLAGGAVLYFTAPDASSRVGLAPSVGPSRGGLALHGTF
ncbi:MAG: hypothetical protein KF764_15905 [Labilithrix sp.]|nr:hypothetical protein [Labilithrix sp.]